MADLNSLPPPPTGQIGMTLDQFQHLPPPPKGQTGVTLDQIKAPQTPQTPQLGQGAAGDFAGNTLRAIASPLVRTGGLIESGLDQTLGRVDNAIAGKGFTPTTTGQQAQTQANNIDAGASQSLAGDIGTGVGTIAPYFLPGAGEEDAVATAGTKAPGILAKTGGYLAKQAPEIAANTAIGTAQTGSPVQGIETGASLGALKGAGDATSALAGKLPDWFVKTALPKLKEGNAAYALDNTSLGTTKGLIAKSDTALSSYGSQIKSILSHPQYAEETGNVKGILPQVQSKLGNAGLQDSKIVSIVKRVAPNNATLVDKVQAGTATLKEQNVLRQELDHAVYPKFTDTPSLTFNKQVGKSFADALRGNVQGTAKETAPVFANYSKEFDLNKALNSAAGRKGLKDTISGGVQDAGAGIAGYTAGSENGGGVVGGLKGAGAAIIAERLAKNPSIKLSAGRALRSLNKSPAGAITGVLAKTATIGALKSQGRTNQ